MAYDNIANWLECARCLVFEDVIQSCIEENKSKTEVDNDNSRILVDVMLQPNWEVICNQKSIESIWKLFELNEVEWKTLDLLFTNHKFRFFFCKSDRPPLDSSNLANDMEMFPEVKPLLQKLLPRVETLAKNLT
jgi:hypothetical protein